MIKEEIENSLKYWNNLHKEYHRNDIKLDDWLIDFDSIISSCNTPILDLGCGSVQRGRRIFGHYIFVHILY